MAEDMAGDEGEGSAEGLEESMSAERAYYLKTKKLLQEKKRRLRERVIRERYFSAKDSVFMHFCESLNFTEWKDAQRGHAMLVPKISENGPLHPYFSVIKKPKDSSNRIRESEETVLDKLGEYRYLNRDQSQELRDSKIREALNFTEAN
jgi:hypothetical protein